MRKAVLFVCLMGIVGTMTACTAENAQVKEYFPDPRVRALVIAADNGDVKKIGQLVTAGVNVNARGKDSMTPLIWLIFHDKKVGYRALLSYGANPNLQIEGGRYAGASVMETAARLTDSSYLKLALEHGGNPNLYDEHNAFYPTPLFSAIIDPRTPLENVKLLIKWGADVNAESDFGTPVMMAVGTRYDIVYTLLQAGADYKSKDKHGETLAARIGRDLGNPNSDSDSPWRRKAIAFLNAHGVAIPFQPRKQ